MPELSPVLRLTAALLEPERAPALAASLAGDAREEVIEGLLGLVWGDGPAAGVLAALKALLVTAQVAPPARAAQIQRAAREALRASQHATVRRVALDATKDAPDDEAAALCAERALVDPIWSLRREAIHALDRRPLPWVWEVWACALDDPHWRPRQAAARRLVAWCVHDEARWSQLRAWAAPRAPQSPPLAGAVRYIGWRRAQQLGQDFEVEPEAPSPPPDFPWWDDDPPVLRRHLRAMSRAELRAFAPYAPKLLYAEDDGVRAIAARALRGWGSTEALREAWSLGRDPRRSFADEAHERLWSRLDLDRQEALARAARAAGELQDPASLFLPKDPCASLPLLRSALGPDEGPRDEGALDPRVRAKALDEAQARALWDEPSLARSWIVLDQAARLLKRPSPRLRLESSAPLHGAFVHNLSTDTPHLSTGGRDPKPTLSPTTQAPPSSSVERDDLPQASIRAEEAPRAGAQIHPWGTRLGISGHYGLPRASYDHAYERGVRMYFWEPNYTELTARFQGWPTSTRARALAVCGSFEAEPALVLKDLERALRMLKVEAVGLFLVFWVRSWRRIAWPGEEEGLREVLERAKADGKLLDYGLSTHQRELALRALGEGWDPIMVRHSAAHRGAERAIFPQAQAVGARVLTFNNLCYGRLLRDPHQRGLVPPTPAECYRYALAQPGVSLCWSAPRDHDELLHNLQVLDEPALSEGRMEELRRFGDVVYEENRMFAECLRWK